VYHCPHAEQLTTICGCQNRLDIEMGRSCLHEEKCCSCMYILLQLDGLLHTSFSVA
jgi:hypothetical protein